METQEQKLYRTWTFHPPGWKRGGAKDAFLGEMEFARARSVMKDHIQEARDSLSRCIQKPEFLDRFYELFIASSDDIRKKFESTDFDRQKKMLQDSLFVMLVAAGTDGGLAHKELSKLADRHSRRGLGIKPEWYDAWLRSLLEAVAEHDPEYRPELSTSWRESLRDGIDLMRSRY